VASVALISESGNSSSGIDVGRLAERRLRQRQQHDEAGEPHGRAFRQRLDEHPAPPAADVEAVHEHGEPLVELAPPASGLEQEVVKARVGLQQKTLDLGFPVLLGIGI
jgi:hypothetical protein